jgi:uncharacterized protein with NRDE domain
MCLLTFALDVHPEYSFVFAANRDEFFDRPTRRAHFWSDAPDVLGGIDIRAGGTWCGIRRDGRFACVTNFREPPVPADGRISRGLLTRSFLTGTLSPESFVRQVNQDGASYAGFNLVVGDRSAIHYVSNRAPGPGALDAGIYGLSNELLDTPWPKVTRAKEGLRDAIAGPTVSTDRLFDLLRDETIAPDDSLPDTGFGRAWERVLSPVFISTSEYGTRCSTVILLRRDGRITFEEMYHQAARPGVARRRFEW